MATFSIYLIAFISFTTQAYAVLGLPSNSPQGISAGERHTCAIVHVGVQTQLKCWGSNEFGQLGIGTQGVDTHSNIPVAVPVESPTAVEAGAHQTCAISKKQAGVKLFCWGHGMDGGLGQGNTVDYPSPTYVNLGQGVIPLSISSGLHNVCVIGQMGNTKRLICWGLNSYGQLGNGNNVTQTSPQTINLGPGVVPVQVDMSDQHTCVVVFTPGNIKQLKCFGRNTYGQLGTGNTSNYNVPQTVSFGANESPIQVSVGINHTCAILSPTNGMGQDQLKCWGRNWQGELGIGSIVDQYTPQPVVNLARLIATGGMHNCARIEVNSVDVLKCWGNNGYVQLGIGNNIVQTLPQLVNLGGTPLRITLGKWHSCALTSGAPNVLKCWGNNAEGQLGVGNNTNSALPLVVP